MAKEQLEKILEILDEENIEYKHLTHDHVHSSHDAAKIRGNRVEQAAKAIVLKVKNSEGQYLFIQCVLPGHKKIDLKKLKQILNLKSAGLASPEEVLEKTGCTIGSVPPFGMLFGLETYADETLRCEEQIVFSAGTHNDSIMLRSKDYMIVAKPRILSFCSE
jgi:prolyl-tRNA editing enzyme YbaK/EbsC (Cys-tRNA(Pro) deacylase)